jgi:hypothetical protein
MRHIALLACLISALATTRLSAQEQTAGWVISVDEPPEQIRPVSDSVLVSQPALATPRPPDASPVAVPAWQTAWGVADLRAIPAGPKVGPNGELYHPNFSLDLNFNIWIWRSQGVYLFTDMNLWGEKSENGVTNARDGFLGTSKREFDLTGGIAWNYTGSCELRAIGYTQNNLNRGLDMLAPAGFQDGFALENRWYLSDEYARLGQTGFDVARATFVSIGYYPSKSMVGNDGQTFQPGLLLRAYLTCDLWDWPCYVFGDVQYISERSLRPRLLLFDLGVAIRPVQSCQQFELRLGAEDTADLQVRNDFNLWYVSLRYVY